MIIVSGYIRVAPGNVGAFVDASREAMRAARAAPGCSAFVVAADPLEAGRVNVYEEWASWEAVEAFRGDGPGEDLSAMIVEARVARHTIADSGPA